ncbi:hypothetical protein B9Z55_025450 [Caenorhabditis nigoni]|nr:hypothetical protein B9Z55_025450 [Caenorhabditis nigoni]
MKKTIKSCQHNRFKSISCIRYCGTNERMVVDIVTKNRMREDFVDIKEHDDSGLDYFQLNVSGKIIDFLRLHFLEAAFNLDESESVFQSIHNYMVDFFGDSMEYFWVTSDFVNTVPQLQKISSFIRVWNVNPDSIDLENFFSRNPPFKRIAFNVFRPTDFSPDSKFYQAESLVTVQHHNNFPSVLRHFQGRQAFVDCTHYNTEDVIEFVNRWKSGETFQKLEVLNFEVSQDDIDHETVLDGIGAKHIDARKTPPTHTLPKIKSRKDHIFEAAFNPDESESVIRSIHNYMLQFFGDSMKYIWSTSDWVNTVPQLQNLSPSILMWHVNPDLIDLENFFSTNPPFKMIEFHPTRPIDFHPDSKFYQAETVVTLQHNHYFPSVLRHFQGKQAFVHCTYHNTEDFIEFVNKWKSGEAFRKLEVLNFKALGDDDIDHETVLNGIGAKHIDARRTPPTHTLPKICDWYQYSPSPYPITSHIYVVRESDNRVASVSVQRRKFHFGVWDKTVEEFLRFME